jgi:hypothetical protein
MSKGKSEKTSEWVENGDWKHKNKTDEDMLGTDRDHVHLYNDRLTGERTGHEKHGGSYSDKVGSSGFGNLIRNVMGWNNGNESSDDRRSDCAPYSDDD